jgi:hypothetical protein
LLSLGAEFSVFQFATKILKIKIYRTIILPFVLYGCETWSLTLREECRLRLFENRVLRRVYWPKRDVVIGEWWELHNEELNPLNAELTLICHLLILLGDLTFMGPCIVNIFQYIYPTRCNVTHFIYISKLLYMFRVAYATHRTLKPVPTFPR